MIAKEANLKLIDIRLSSADPTTLNGFPRINPKTGRSYYAVPETFPLASDPLPLDEDGNEMEGWLLLLDEINSAPKAVEAAAYRVVLDHEAGDKPMHPRCFKIAAGNLITDGAIVNELGTAMQSRLAHFTLVTHTPSFLWWAESPQVDLDERIIAFIRFSQKLNEFDPDHNDLTYPCERTWEFVHEVSHDIEELTIKEHLPLIAAQIGFAVAREYIVFTEIYKDLPKIKDILKDPENHPMPTRKDVLFAITTSLAKIVDESNAEDILKYLRRTEIEFQIITLQNAIQRNKKLVHIKAVATWKSDVAKRMAKVAA